MKLSEEERFKGWLLLEQLQSRQQQDTTGGVTQARMSDAYLHKEKIMQEVQKRILEMAPHGVQSQGEFLDLLEKAINSIGEDFKKTASDEALLSDIDLTTSMIERTLRMVPFQVFFAKAAR